MRIEQLTANDFEEAMDFMNMVFGAHGPHDFANLSSPKSVVFGVLTLFYYRVVFSQLAGVVSGSADVHRDCCR